MPRLSETAELERGAALTALVLRDIASHISRGDVMMLSGVWSDRYEDTARPARKRYRKWYAIGRRQSTSDAVYALIRVAEMNDPRERP